MRINRFDKEAFMEWVMDLNTQTLTRELKSTICDEFEAIQDHPDIVLAIDFDLTICMSDYPALGKMRPGAGSVIRTLYEEGFGIVINTCREGHALSDAMHWLKEKDIPYDYVNCNFPHLITKYGADCRKISADMYIYDKGVEPLPNWGEIYELIQNKFKNKEDE
jgi:hypothetical protein